jgi:uncharacterized SAM-binding protein YcdF (DUF218 family)
MFADLGIYKSWLTAWVLPPAAPLLLILFGYWLSTKSEREIWRASGKLAFWTGFVVLWLACCYGTAMYLSRVILPRPLAIEPATAAKQLKEEKMQAIVVLGGGMNSASREYGLPGLSDHSAKRLHYGATLRQLSGLPLAFSGGTGWSAASSAGTEAQAAQRWLTQLNLPPLKWQESASRDTAGNAQAVSTMLKKDGITRIVLVTDAMHMPRAVLAFQGTGMTVLPAPTYFLESEAANGLDWFPSGQGLYRTRQVLHEWLGLRVARKSAQEAALNAPLPAEPAAAK